MPDEYVDLEYDQQRIEASRGVLELAVRQLRAFARCVTAGRAETDELVEDTLMLFLAEDRILYEAGACFAELLSVFRRVQARAAMLSAGPAPSDAQYAVMQLLTVPEREIAALCMSAGMGAGQAAELLNIPLTEAEELLEISRSKLSPAFIPEWPFSPAPLAGSSADGDGNIR